MCVVGEYQRDVQRLGRKNSNEDDKTRTRAVNYLRFESFHDFPNFLTTVKQGASRGAASGGSDF